MTGTAPNEAETWGFRSISLMSVPNMRDLGGVPSRSGWTRWGRVFRSTALNRITQPDMDRIRELGISLVADLRSQSERDRSPDRLPPGTGYLPLDVLADAPTTDPAILGRIMTDPTGTSHLLADGKSHQFMLTAYQEIVALPSALSAYRSLMLAIADPGSGPILIHCTTGKDRTGWAAAIALGIADVPREHIIADYLQTNVDLAVAVEPVLARYTREGGNPDNLRPLLSVAPEYLEMAYETMCAHFGSFQGYLSKGLGLDREDIAAIRDRLLTESDKD